MERQYSLKIYSYLETFLLFIFTLLLSTFILGFVGKIIGSSLSEIGRGSIKLILILILVKVFMIAVNIITIIVTIRMDDDGLLFEFEKSRLGIHRKNIFIRWAELEGWHWSEQNIPFVQQFILKYLKKKRIVFYYPPDNDNTALFETFHKRFIQKVSAINVKKNWVLPIKDLSYAQMYRNSHIVFSILVLSSIPIFSIYFFTKTDHNFKWIYLIILGYFGFWVYLSVDYLRELLKKD